MDPWGRRLNLDREMSRYLVVDEESIRNVLGKIDGNDEGIAVCVDATGILLGVLTDGDLRRWIIDEENPDLNQPVSQIVNRDCTSARISDDASRIEYLFNQDVHLIPLTDSQGRCVAVARPREAPFVIAGRKIGPGKPCFVIAEIGINHNGSIDRAFELIDAAVQSGADCVKFQMRDLSTLYANKGDATDHREDLGSQYTLDLLTRFQLSEVEMFQALDRCHEHSVVPLVTPWDLTSMDQLEGYGLEAYKVASADFTNHPFLQALSETGKPLVCSTGMTTEAEIRQSVDLLTGMGCQFALLHCNSTYPAPFKDVNLVYMETLRDMGGCPVGYSGHERGINVAIAAVARGADIVEKHFTLDRRMEGNDHRVSLEPDEFAHMVESIREVELSIGLPTARRISQGEMMNRESLGKSLVANTLLGPGNIVERHMVDVRSPGRGLQPNRIGELIGRTVRRTLQPGDMFAPSDLGIEICGPRQYSFTRPVGIPVRYHDLGVLGTAANFDFLEFHLSYKDLEEDESAFFSEALDMDLVVHSPDLFENDHILDLSACDDNYRRTSIDHLARVIEVTHRLSEWFTQSRSPRVVVSVGGLSQDTPIDESQRSAGYDMILDSLGRLDLAGIEVLPQTMPPFPWYFGGQRFMNLFVSPWEIADFCDANNYRVCFDTSHSKLACTQNHWSFSEFVRTVGPYSSHLHLGDATGVDGEGLQVLEGDIDWVMLGRELRESAPEASFIPEIWQGHKNNGEGFWKALESLESFF